MEIIYVCMIILGLIIILVTGIIAIVQHTNKEPNAPGVSAWVWALMFIGLVIAILGLLIPYGFN